MDRRLFRLLTMLVAMGIWLAGAWPVRGQSARDNPGNKEKTEPRAAISHAPTAATVDELSPVEVPVPSDKALRYYHGGMWIWALSVCWGLVVPALIVFTAVSAALRNLARRLGRWWFPTVGLYVVLYLAIDFLIDLPLNYYLGFVRQHAYGLSNQSLTKWLTDSLLSVVIAMITGFAFAWVPYLLLQRAPRRWWLYTSLLSVPFLFVSVLVKPIWIDPLFNDFGPMKNKELEQSILDLASRSGIAGSRVFEVDKSVDTNALNAYVTGVLGSKRIVLWDTLIARLERKELLAVMAHEMGHYVLSHVVRSILLSSFLTLTGLFLVDRLGRWVIHRYSHVLRFESLADVASVPLLLLLLQVASLFLTPIAMAYSRYQEHEADRFALDLTRTNHSAATAFVKLQQDNLSNPRPGLIYQVFRASHPSIGERIDFCNTYRPAAEPTPVREEHD
jgi:Zn-dependent protease with chaperone function